MTVITTNIKNMENLTIKKTNLISNLDSSFYPQQSVEPIKEEEKKYKNGFEQWSVNGDEFYAASKTVGKIPCGQYVIKYNQNKNCLFLKKIDVVTCDLFNLPNKIHEEVINDIKHFWSSKHLYKTFGNVYKRNILIHSVPGNGKTSLISLLINDLITNQDGFVIRLQSCLDLENYDNLISVIKEIEPNRNIIVIMEDFEDLVLKIGSESLLLNILDGVKQNENILTIATTNYPERLRERYLNRPTRFNRVIEYPKPDEKVRRYYISEKLNKCNIPITESDLDSYVDSTKNYTMDHLKEFLQMIYVDECSVEKANEMLSEMVSKKGNYKNSENNSNIGFNKN